MARRSIEKVLHELNELEEERRRLYQEMARGDPLLAGSLSVVRRTCGKKSCHCAQEPGHPVTVLMLTVKKRRVCKVVRKDDIKEVTRKVDQYKEFRAGLRALKHLNSQENAILRELMRLRSEIYR